MEAVERLEKALDRIATRAGQTAAPTRAEPDLAEIVRRLDAAIARLRAGLGTAGE
jgi:hypothetical protein